MVLGRVRDAVNEIVGDDAEQNVAVLPTDDDVVREAAGKAGVDHDRVAEITSSVQDVLDRMYPELIEESVPADDALGSGSSSDEDGFLYAFDDTDDVLVVGGAAGVLTGLGDRLGLSQIEVEAVRQAHRIAANRNGYARHVVMDDVVLARDRHIDASTTEGSTRNDALAETVGRIADEGYELPEASFVAELVLDDEKYFGVEVTLHDGVTLSFDPGDRDAPYHAVIAPEGTVRVSPSMGEALGLRSRDVTWSSSDGAIEARFGSLVDEVPGGRQTKIVEREGWQGHVPKDVLDRVGLTAGDEVAVTGDAVGDETVIVVSGGHVGDGVAVGSIAESGIGADRTVLELPESVSEVLELGRGNVNVAWDVVDDRLVGALML